MTAPAKTSAPAKNASPSDDSDGGMYRIVVVFAAGSDGEANERANAAVKACGGSLTRITVAATTWTPLKG